MIDVLLFKSENESLEFKSHLLSSGFNPIFVQVLDFDFENLDELYSKLSRSNEYDGLIFTSAKAVEASNQCLKGKDSDVENLWLSKPIFVVGEKTEAAARGVFGLRSNTLGSSSGNADQLANFIISSALIQKKSYLFPCGSLRLETLPKKLAIASLSVDSIVVYKSKKCPELESTLKKMIDKLVLPNIFTFFSPSGVEYVMEVLKSLKFDYSNINFFAIGPVTGEKITKVGCNVKGVSNKPNAESLVKTLKSEYEKPIRE